MNPQTSELTTVLSAIEAIAADNLKPSGQQRGLMLLPEYVGGIETFRSLWHRFYGPSHDFEKPPNCRDCQFKRLQKLSYKLQH